jgi:Mce-associated membrane protein
MTNTHPTSGPTWYDLLGVSRNASADEIKAAWRSATDRFEPGSAGGQFQMFNQAADVLLDPERRAAYDRSLDRDRPDTEVPPPPPEPVPAAPAAPTTTVDPKAERRAARARRRAEAKAAAGPATPVEPASRQSLLLVAGLALLLVLALVLAGYFALQVRKDARVADAREQAPAAAERAAKAVLSYDYTRLDADEQRAKGFLTPSYGKEFEKTFALLKENKDGSPGAAVQTKAKVSASVVGSGVVDAEDGVVRVLLYVNQVSRKAGADPQVFQNRVTLTMEKNDEKWLVDDLKSY